MSKVAVCLLFIASALSVFAVVASAAPTGSFGYRPPDATLMRGEDALQVQSFTGGSWVYYHDGGKAGGVYDNFGEYHFPKATVVPAGTRLHVRLTKPERPRVMRISAYPKTKDGQFGGKLPAGPKQQLDNTLKPVRKDDKIVAWDAFFRTPKQPYLVVHSVWPRVPGMHASYGSAGYAFHVNPRKKSKP